MSRIVDTDNFDGDYPNERFLLWPMSEADAMAIAGILNNATSEDHPRFYKVVDDAYKLQPGFEP